MKKTILLLFCFIFGIGTLSAKENQIFPEEMSANKEIKVLKKGCPFSYPLPNGTIIECYAKKVDGSIDDFAEYNDYFVMQNGGLYSNTMHKIYKPNKANKLKKVDQASMLNDDKTLKLYDPLWEGSVRHHTRTIKINTQTGEYFMTGIQDNWMWYRNVTATGYCRPIYPKTNLAF